MKHLNGVGNDWEGKSDLIWNIKPYPKYKDSGVPWLGEVPVHWEVRRLKSSVAHINEHTNAKNPDELYIALEHVESWTGRLRAPSGNVEFDSQVKRFHAGDVLFGKLRPYLAKVVRPEQDGVCVGEFFVLRPKYAVTPRYLEVVLRSAPAIDFVNSSTYGAKMPRADWTFIGGMLFPHPSIPEQTAIVRFLDWADVGIQRVIRAREKRIKLLEEYKQALINQAVTGQIDVRTGKPYPKYKDSGVEWLGEVPAHWEVHRLKAIARIRYGLGQPPRETESGVPMLRATNVCRGIIVENDLMHVDPEEVPENRGAFLKAGEIIVVRSGAYTADSAIIPSRFGGAVAGYDMVLTAKLVSPEFLAFVLLTPYVRDNQLIIASMRSAQPHLNAEELGAALIVTPPIEEQNTIVLFLDEQTERIDAAIAADHRVIDLLKEFRTRLIADVVTGKLDVREAAAKLPDQLEESETMDDLDKLLSVEHQDDNNDGNNDHHEKHDDSQ